MGFGDFNSAAEADADFAPLVGTAEAVP